MSRRCLFYFTVSRRCVSSLGVAAMVGRFYTTFYTTPPSASGVSTRTVDMSVGKPRARRRSAKGVAPIIRPSRFPWPRKSPRAWKRSRRCDDREEGRSANEQGERPSWKPSADGRTDVFPNAPRLRVAETKSALMKLSLSRSLFFPPCLVDS